MKYIIGNRQSGVTTDLILEANRSGAVIVTTNQQMKQTYERRARELNIYPPKVYTIDELSRDNQVGYFTMDRIVIDNFDIVFRQILRSQYGIDAKVDAIGTTLDNIVNN